MKKLQLLMVAFMLIPVSVFAYIGPGAGLGAIATFVAIVFGLILLFVGFLWYPLKRFLKKRHTNDNDAPGNENERSE